VKDTIKLFTVLSLILINLAVSLAVIRDRDNIITAQRIKINGLEDQLKKNEYDTRMKCNGFTTDEIIEAFTR